MKYDDYRQGPFVRGGGKPSGGPFVGGRSKRSTRPSVSPQPSGRAPESRPGGPQRGRGAWRHIAIAVAVAGLIGVLRAGVEAGKTIDLPDFSNLPGVNSKIDVSVPTIEEFSVADTPDSSEDPKVKTSSQIVTVVAVRGDAVQLRNILGRELTWQIKCPKVRRAIVAATGEKPILSWERDAQGEPTVHQVLHDGGIVQCS